MRKEKKNREKKKREKKNREKKRPAICLSLSCDTIEQLKTEIEEYREYCQIVEWCVDKTAGSKDYTEEEFKTILKEIKKLCREKKLIVDYKGDEEVGNRIQRWAMGHRRHNRFGRRQRPYQRDDKRGQEEEDQDSDFPPCV